MITPEYSNPSEYSTSTGSRTKPQIKAIVYIRGAKDQTIYGADLAKLRARAIRLLTSHEPGWAGCYPDRISIFTGDKKNWDCIETLRLSHIPLHVRAYFNRPKKS